MKISIFKNGTGVVHGSDPKRIECERSGILKIGNAAIEVTAGKVSLVPMLFYGCTGDYDATFTDKDGIVYRLKKVEVRNGWIKAPHDSVVELMEFRCRLDTAEDNIDELSNIFDTNSLNFIIKGEKQ